ncbi:MAG: peptidoglycan D,D-transpeptidase FtsI family protein [Oligosphaeraceae bacterium]
MSQSCSTPASQPSFAGRLRGVLRKLPDLWQDSQPWKACPKQGREDMDGKVFTTKMRGGLMARGKVLGFFLFLVLVALLCHLIQLQLAQEGYYQGHARRLSTSFTIETPKRGSILDLNGNKFAVDQATKDLYAEPRRFQEKIPLVAKIMARHLNLDAAQLEKRFRDAAAHEFVMKLSDGIPMDYVKEHSLGRIPGIILRPTRDAQGRPAGFKVYLSPRKLSREKVDLCLQLIPECFDINRVELKANIQKTQERCQEIAVKRGVSREDADRILKELEGAGIRRGVRYLDSWIRFYPRNSEMANLLGYTNSENRGVSGIEALMDSYLKPTPGKIALQKDHQGNPLSKAPSLVKQAVDGSDVYLTIQEPIQRILEEELAVLWEKNRPDRAFAIMLDPSTGAIMGLAQFPQFNPNDRSTMEDPDLCQNHILLQCYDPGSIMKAVSLSAVLDAGVADLGTVKDCEKGRWTYNRKALRDSHPYEDLTLAQVIQKSSNIGTAKFALDLGEERMYGYLRDFGFGKPTGLGFYPAQGAPVVFRQEARGMFRALHQWDSLTITRVPMGQGITVPLLQMLQAWSALANHGEIMQPYLVDRVQHADGTVEYSQPRVKATPVSASAVEKMNRALTMVTQKGGTGTRASVKNFTVAGKTGTGQMWIQPDLAKGIRGHYAENQFVASFIGFAPASRPRFLLLVSAENPTTGAHTGAGVAAPVFQRIASRALEYLQVVPDAENPPLPGKGTPSSTARR